MTGNKKLKALAEQVLISEIVTQAKFAEKAADQLAKSSDSIEIWVRFNRF